MKKQFVYLIVGVLVVVLSACGNASDKESGEHAGMNDGSMNHSSSGEVPDTLKKAEDPKFKVGTQAVIVADHMQGMDGATIVGAFDTTVYTVSYTTPEGEEVKNHKWVIHEEIKDAKGTPYQPGEMVTLEADHIQGMDGVTAQIDSAEQTTVYMVDFMPTTGGDMVENHKWVTESELKAE